MFLVPSKGMWRSEKKRSTPCRTLDEMLGAASAEKEDETVHMNLVRVRRRKVGKEIASDATAPKTCRLPEWSPDDASIDVWDVGQLGTFLRRHPDRAPRLKRISGARQMEHDTPDMICIFKHGGQRRKIEISASILAKVPQYKAKLDCAYGKYNDVLKREGMMVLP